MPTFVLLTACCVSATSQVDAGCVPNAQAARDACKQLVSRLHSPDGTAAPNGTAARRDDFRALNGARQHVMWTEYARLHLFDVGRVACAWAQDRCRPSGKAALPLCRAIDVISDLQVGGCPCGTCTPRPPCTPASASQRGTSYRCHLVDSLRNLLLASRNTTGLCQTDPRICGRESCITKRVLACTSRQVYTSCT